MGFRERWSEVQARVASACALAGRNVADVTVIAVTKGAPTGAVQEAYDCGVRTFGESRLQEAAPKIEALPKDIVWHFIGKLQSNKAKKVATLFEAVHTIENEDQIREIEK